MQTYAQHPQPAEVIDLEYTGTLLHCAQARSKVLDHDGHTVPVLCMDIELDNPLRTPMHIEQPYPIGQHAEATAAAHKWKKGMRITVQAPLVGVRLIATNATLITAAPAAQPTETTEPCQPSLL